MPKPQENLSIFFDLIKQGDTEKVREMIQSGHPVNARFVSGITPVISATYHGHLDTVKVLVEAGADVNLWDEDLDTPLLCAINFGYWDIVTYLVPFTDREILEMVEHRLIENGKPHNKPL